MALLGSGIWSRTGVISSPLGEDEDVFELPMSQRRTPRLFKAALSTFISNASSRVNLSADASSGPRSCGHWPCLRMPGRLQASLPAPIRPALCSSQSRRKRKSEVEKRRGGASFASCSIPVRAMGPTESCPILGDFQGQPVLPGAT